MVTFLAERAKKLKTDDAHMPENEFTFNSLAKIIKSKEQAEAFKKQLKAL
jgi:hypothetical protein